MSRLLIFLLQILFINLFLYKSHTGDAEMVGVSVFFRHGDRTIIMAYPNDPYKNASFWPEGFGQLTNKGKIQQFELGKWFRTRYNDFLTKLYTKEDMYVLSTDYDRTLMSAESNLAGLFPPVKSQMWNPNLKWQPIPIHTIPVKFDNQLSMEKHCPKYNTLITELLDSPAFIKLRKDNQKLFSYITAHAGYVVNNLTFLEYLYNDLFIESEHNFTLPNWTKSVFPSKMQPLAEFSFAVSTFTHELARLKVGTLLHKIAHQFKNLENNKTATKYMVYSAHDTTIADILNSLDLFQYHCPPYAATILFELHKNNNGKHFVNILYKNSSVPQEMVLKNCTFDCPLDEFLSIIEPLRLTTEDWDLVCTGREYLDAAVLEGYLLLSSFIIAVLILNGLIGFLIYRKLKNCSKPVYVVLPKNEKYEVQET